MLQQNSTMIDEFVRRLRAGEELSPEYHTLPDYQEAWKIVQNEKRANRRKMVSDIIDHLYDLIEIAEETPELAEEQALEKFRNASQSFMDIVTRLLKQPFQQKPIEPTQAPPRMQSGGLSRRKKGVRGRRPYPDYWMARNDQPLGTVTPFRCIKISKDKQGVPRLHNAAWYRINLGDPQEFFKHPRAEPLLGPRDECKNDSTKVDIPDTYVLAEKIKKRNGWKFKSWSSEQAYLKAREVAEQEIDEAYQA